MEATLIAGVRWGRSLLADLNVSNSTLVTVALVLFIAVAVFWLLGRRR